MLRYGQQEHQTAEIAVLLLDDDAFDRRRLARMGAASGLSMCMDAVPTIEDMKKSIDEKTFDVIFLDYQLSSGTGLDALGLIREHPIQERAAVVMLSGNRKLEVAIAALKSGCSDYISKDDLTPNMLREAVLRVLPAIDMEPEVGPPLEQQLDAAIDALLAQRIPQMLQTILESDTLQQKWQATLSASLRTSLHEVLETYDLQNRPLCDAATIELAKALSREATSAIMYD